MTEFSITGTISFNIEADNEQDAIEEFMARVAEEATCSPSAFDDINVERLSYEDND